MSPRPDEALEALSLRYLLDFPREAAGLLEQRTPQEIAGVLADQPLHAIVAVWARLPGDVEEAVLDLLPPAQQRDVLAQSEPARTASLLSRYSEAERKRYLDLLPDAVRTELTQLMAYPQDSAGQLMNPRVVSVHQDLSVADALHRLRVRKREELREIYLIDTEDRLTGRIPMLDLAVADPDERLHALMRGVPAAARDSATREEVVALIQTHSLTDLPVTDIEGRLLGVIGHDKMLSAMQEETSTDIQTMVGASADERATSSAFFAVRKRLPWLQINLLTAFLAAAVVGIFEGTVARFTALAVLLPVVAGQSGNAGAQALAVTMRGLVLREISLRHWPAVVRKEVGVGLINGVAIALTTGLAVYVWSRSLGLVLIIASAMVISMIAAGFAGALVPIVLRRMGQDPASSSSIILTTVTDVVGFFSFLGIATALSGLLVASGGGAGS